MDELSYLLTFTIGLLGSLHCIGMCGGFPVGLSTRAPTHAKNILSQLAYNAGKTVTYGFLGAVMGYLGRELWEWDLFVDLQELLAMVSGFFLILIALQVLGYASRLKVPTFLIEGAVSFGGLLNAFRREEKAASAFYLGLFNGFLPCALVYAMAARAASTGSILSGMIDMFAFGIGTMPSLLLLGISGRAISSRLKERAFAFSGGVIFLLGIITVMRGFR